MNVDIMMKQYENYERDSIIQNFIAQANSRYILYNSMEPEEKFPNYTRNLDERCLHIAFSYLNFGWNFYDNNKSTSLYCIEKAAEVLEHLYAYRHCDKIFREYYSLVCALGYYVSSQYSKSFIVLKHYACQTDLANMIRCFAIRDMKELDIIISNIYFEVRGNDKIEEIDSLIYKKILANAFNDMLRYIYTGEYRFMDSSKKILKDLIDLSSINDEPHMWWIFRLLYLIFDEYEEASLWTVLPPVIVDSEDRKKYIRANIYKKTPIVELFKSQRGVHSTK